MTVAIVGAGGYLGVRLQRALDAAGIQTLAISSAAGGFDLGSGIIAVPAAAARVSAVVYLSQSPHYRDVPARAAHLWGVNVVSALAAAEWARHAGAARFIYASTGNVYEPSFVPLAEEAPLRRDDWYALSKVHAEEALALYGDSLAVTRVRLFGIYGPDQPDKLVTNLARSVRDRRPIRLQVHPADRDDSGGVRLSLSYVDDVVDVLRHLALEGGPHALNVAGPDVRSVREIATGIGAWLGIDPLFEAELRPRRGDLVADRTRLCRVWTRPFRSFDVGLRLALGAA